MNNFIHLVFTHIVLCKKNHICTTGFQKKSSGKVAETLGMPNAHAFQMKYVKQGRPVNIREGLKNLPVYKLWKEDKYLKDK